MYQVTSRNLMKKLFVITVGLVGSAIICPASVPVALSSSYNVMDGITKDGTTFSGSSGLDGGGAALSANLLEPSQVFAGIRFNLGPANALDAVSSTTISLPHQKFSTLALLATAVQGNQTDQTFTVNYVDGTSKIVTQSLSDWYTPQNYSGEFMAVDTPHRNRSNGSTDERPFHLYAYLLGLDNSKALASLTLPANRNVVVLAVSLSVTPVSANPQSVSLQPYFNQLGITTDGTPFTGGLSGLLETSTYAFSAQVLGTSQTFDTLPFTFGAPNKPNVVSSTGQTIALPQNRYTILGLLATSVGTVAKSETFKIQYTDGTSSALTHSFGSLEYPSVQIPGQTVVVQSPYLNNYDGKKIQATAGLYGYTFILNETKMVESIVLPNDSDIKIFAITLSPVSPKSPPSSACGTANGVLYNRVYSSTLSTWCVDASFWPANQAAISRFFSYGDAVIAQDIKLFKNQPQGLPFVFQVSKPTGFASTGTDFGPLGDTVTGDAFSNSYTDPVTHQTIPGFWGYLLTLHESVNVFTGLVSGGWPTDWWADHRSPFPNAMDEEFMRSIGKAQNNPTLLAAADAHHERFADPKQPGYDAETAMFVNFYNQFGGFPPFATTFQLVQEDGLEWETVNPGSPGNQNHGERLSEYVIAYLQLGFHTTSDLTPTFIAAGVGTKDPAIPAYTPLAANVEAIANAHCSIEAARGAGVDVSAQLSALQHGDFQNAKATGGTAATCPSECSVKAGQCVAPWSK